VVLFSNGFRHGVHLSSVVQKTVFSGGYMPGEIEIKPCPFCGGTAAIVRGCTHLNSKWQFKVFCKRCQVRQPLHKTKCGAITEWNHRAKLVVKNGSSHNK
jgi:Lar family restriction alleviation protein